IIEGFGLWALGPLGLGPWALGFGLWVLSGHSRCHTAIVKAGLKPRRYTQLRAEGPPVLNCLWRRRYRTPGRPTFRHQDGQPSDTRTAGLQTPGRPAFRH